MEFNPLHFTDQNGTPLALGDTVKVTKGKNKGNSTWIFVFCIPQHRFGFMINRFYHEFETNDKDGLYGEEKRVPEPFIVDYPNLDFYWTPKSKMEIAKI